LPPKLLNAVAQVHVDAIFKHIWPTLKLATYMAERQKAVADNLAAHLKDPVKNPLRDPADMGREIADATNRLFGGINWAAVLDNMDSGVKRRAYSVLFSPSGRRMQQIAFMAPDWNVSAVTAWTEAIKAITPGIPKKASDALYRNYMAFSAITALALGSYIQEKKTGVPLWENEDWSKIDLGNGTNIVSNKHFFEAWHLVNNPGQFLLNKLNVLPREVIDQVLGKQYVIYKPWEQGMNRISGPPLAGIADRAAHVAKAFLPISGKTIDENGPAAWLLSQLGLPLHGTPTEQRIMQVREKAIAEGADPDAAQARYMKNKDKFQEIDVRQKAAHLPGKDIATVRARAEAEGKDPDAAEAAWQEAKDKRDAALAKFRDRQRRIEEWRASHQ
jgi:hypothetical protein